MKQATTASLFEREQFRMARLQVFNWGTFSGLHSVPISERGFLIVGRSGAGKSTLLDAFSALLVPPRWVDFNAAAREADRAGRDRNLISYVRGAWAAQSDAASGEYATRYLRTGTTWSAISLHYKNANGQDVVLVRLFWVRGNANGNADVRIYFLIFERPFDLAELEEFGNTNFDVRKLKQSFPDAYAKEEFAPYCERFSRLLGIESPMALRLLHKTQSAKNLGDLNTFLRDFMLDKPETFEVAERLVNEFGELNAAHQAVVTAREQVHMLAPARSRHEELSAFQRQRNELDELRAGMNSYREQRRADLLKTALAELAVETEGRAGDLRRREDTLANRSARLRDLQRVRSEAGGDQIEHWQSECAALEEQKRERLRRRQQAVDACNKLGWTFPASPQGFAELLATARHEMEQFAGDDALQDEILASDRLRTDAAGRRAAVAREIDSLRRQPSSIPAHMLEMRRDLARAISVAESALPFAGELMEVKADEAPWRGAAERVLHGFALSVLVDEANYGALVTHINGVNLGRRLVYFRTGRAEGAEPRPLRAQSLVTKLNVKDSPHAAWLQQELRQRFDYECVESVKAFRAAPERALTREGQVKHSRSRHEKDDRSDVNARQNWVLGFDNREKLALFEQEERDLQSRIGQLERAIAALRSELTQRGARAVQAGQLANLNWQDVDAAPLADRIAHITRQLKEAQDGNATLRRIEAQISGQQALVADANTQVNDARVEHSTCLRRADELQRQLQATLDDASAVALTPFQQRGLSERYAALPQPLRLDAVDSADRAVGKALVADMEALARAAAQCEKEIEAIFAAFIGRWKGDADGLDASLGAAADFFVKLARLETDGLPQHEQRFFELLQNQSNQNLAALSSYLNNARKAILERMDLVNESLRQVPFNQSADLSTYLHIEPSDRQLPEVRAFRQDIQKALADAWSDDPAVAEQRFVALRSLVERLASQEPEQRRWRDAVLDVRLHVEFTGREIDTEGNEVEVYQSGAGKSGGQRQKLATTCLAAALRYQLGGSDHGLPIYAPVVLDEAFDKADNEFTALAMNIFANFGFQMIVATPLKSVMTLEPFIGGACFVDIRDRRVSGVLLIEYDEGRQRLQLPEHTRREAVLEAAA